MVTYTATLAQESEPIRSSTPPVYLGTIGRGHGGEAGGKEMPEGSSTWGS